MSDARIPREFERQMDRDVEREWGEEGTEIPDPKVSDDEMGDALYD